MKFNIGAKIIIAFTFGILIFSVSVAGIDTSHFDICLFSDSWAANDEIKNDNNNVLISWTKWAIYEFAHFGIAESIVGIFSLLILPLLIAAWYFIKRRLREKVKKIQKNRDNELKKNRFEKVFEDGNKESLKDEYIINALQTARSSNRQEKRTAILQLSEFSQDSALTGLINLLYFEKDLAFKYSMIHALSCIVEKRQEIVNY